MVLASGAGAAGGALAPTAGAGARPPTTDPGPRCPMMPSSQRADDEQHRADGGRARQHRGAAPRAERRLAAAAAERVGDVAALALLEQHDQHQHEADQDVNRRDEVIQHRISR